MVTAPLALIKAPLPPATTLFPYTTLFRSGPDTLTATVDDQGNTGSGGPLSDRQSVPISVSAVNDASVLTVPGPQATSEDIPTVITGLSVADVDAGAASVQLTLGVLHGTLSLST